MSLFHFLDIEDEVYYNDIKPEVKEISFEDKSLIDELDNFQIYAKKIEECKKWFEEYKMSKTPRVLMLIGKKGCGKSTLAKLLLKKYGYDAKEIINDDQFTKKQLTELIKNAFVYKNLNEYSENEKKYGFIFDDIELMLELGDNIIFNEIMTIIKSSKKCDIKREKSMVIDDHKKRRSKKDQETNGLNVNIVNLNEVSLYNPIICTCNYTNDKKMNELKKLCKVIELGTPSDNECDIILNHLMGIYNIKINEIVKVQIYEYCEYDIRKIKSCIFEIMKLKSFDKVITKKEFDLYKLIYGKSDLNCQLNEATYRILRTPLNVNEIEILYSLDTLLIPLMIQHNLIEYIKNCDIKKDNKKDSSEYDPFKIKFEIYEKCMQSMCEYDKIQTFIYKNREWDLLPSLTAIESLYVPNLYLQKLNYINNGKFKIQFTNILNKISQLEVNKKMIQNAYFSINRLIIDDDELIYLIEIFLNYLKINRNVIEYDECENEGEVKEEKRQRRTYIEVNSDINKSPYKKLIEVMNKYNIDIKSLETILKIEKLNLFENKNPKRMTMRMKEELENFVIAQSVSIEDE